MSTGHCGFPLAAKENKITKFDALEIKLLKKKREEEKKPNYTKLTQREYKERKKRNMRIINLDRYQTKGAGKEDTREDWRRGSDFESTVI